MQVSDILALASITLVIITIIFQISFFIIQNVHARAAARNNARLVREMRTLLMQIGRAITGEAGGVPTAVRRGNEKVPTNQVNAELVRELRDIRSRINSLERSLSELLAEEPEERLEDLDEGL